MATPPFPLVLPPEELDRRALEDHLQKLEAEETRLNDVKARRQTEGSWTPRYQHVYDQSIASLKARQFQARSGKAQADAAARGIPAEQYDHDAMVPPDLGAPSNGLERAGRAMAAGALGGLSDIADAATLQPILQPLGEAMGVEVPRLTAPIREFTERFVEPGQVPDDIGAVEGFLTDTLPRAGGSMLPFMGAARIGAAVATRGAGAASAAVRQALAQRGATIASGVAGAGMEASALQREAQAAGASPGRQLLAAAAGVPIGASESLLFGLEAGLGAGMARRVAAGFLTEGGQEAGQTTAENLVAKGLWEPERAVFQGTIESGLAGGILGGGFGALDGNQGPAAQQAPRLPRTVLQSQLAQINARGGALAPLGGGSAAPGGAPAPPGGVTPGGTPPPTAPMPATPALVAQFAQSSDAGLIKAIGTYLTMAQQARERGNLQDAAEADVLWQTGRDELARRAAGEDSAVADDAPGIDPDSGFLPPDAGAGVPSPIPPPGPSSPPSAPVGPASPPPGGRPAPTSFGAVPFGGDPAVAIQAAMDSGIEDPDEIHATFGMPLDTSVKIGMRNKQRNEAARALEQARTAATQSGITDADEIHANFGLPIEEARKIAKANEPVKLPDFKRGEVVTLPDGRRGEVAVVSSSGKVAVRYLDGRNGYIVTAFSPDDLTKEPSPPKKQDPAPGGPGASPLPPSTPSGGSPVEAARAKRDAAKDAWVAAGMPSDPADPVFQAFTDAMSELKNAEKRAATPQVAAAPRAAPQPAVIPTESAPAEGVPDEKYPNDPSIRRVPVADINVDPSRFQFKHVPDTESGTTDKLDSVRAWDDAAAGIVFLWRDPADGKVYVVNGHHRVALAKRVGQPDLRAAFIKAGNAQAARAVGALQNLREGQGTEFDAAKFMRDTGMTPAGMEEANIALNDQRMRNAVGLAALRDDFFNAAIRNGQSGRDPLSWYVTVGREVPDHGMQEQVFAAIAENRPSNNEELYQRIRLMKDEAAKQVGLFGDDEAAGLLNERAKVIAWLVKRLRGDARIMGVLGDRGRAGRIEQETGSKIDAKAAAEKATEFSQVEAVVNKIAGKSGDIGSAVTAAAKRLKDGEDLETVAQSILGTVREAALREIQTLGNTEGRGDQGEPPPGEDSGEGPADDGSQGGLFGGGEEGAAPEVGEDKPAPDPEPEPDKKPDPKRFLFIGRGAHGNVRVDFGSELAARLYALTSSGAPQKKGWGDRAMEMARLLGVADDREVMRRSRILREHVKEMVKGHKPYDAETKESIPVTQSVLDNVMQKGGTATEKAKAPAPPPPVRPPKPPEPPRPPQPPPPPGPPKKPPEPPKPRVAPDDAAAKAREALRAKFGKGPKHSLGQKFSLGPKKPEPFTSEDLDNAMTLAAWHIENGTASYDDFVNAMVEDIGEGIRPYLRPVYESARHYEGLDTSAMTPAAEINERPPLDDDGKQPEDEDGNTQPDVRDMTDEEWLTNAGVEVVERTSKRGSLYWNVRARDRSMLDAIREHLDDMGFAAPRNEFGWSVRSYFKKNPQHDLANRLRGIAVSDTAEAPAYPTLPREEAETEIKGFGVEVKRAVQGGWLIIGKAKFTKAIKDILRAVGGFWTGSNWRFNDDPTERLGAALRRRRIEGGGGAPVRDNAGTRGRADQVAHAAEVRARLDGSPDQRRPPEELRSSVDEGTRALIQRGLAKGMAEVTISEQLEDIGAAAHAFDNGKPMFLIASAAGSGKTFVLGGIVRMLRAKGVKSFAYVTVNKGVIKQNQRDLKDYGLDGVAFFTYNDLNGTTGRADEIKNLPEGTVLILDETHKVKNIDVATGSAMGKAGKSLMSQAKFTVLASATPYENPVEAQVLEATGIFKGIPGGFFDWVRAYGARVKKARILNPATKRFDTFLVPYWPGASNEQTAAATAARQWLLREGVYTQRGLRLPPGMVTTTLDVVDVDEEIAEFYGKVDAAYAQALAEGSGSDEDGDSAPSGTAMMIKAHREGLLKRILEAAKVQAAIDRAKAELAGGKSVALFTETKSDRHIGRWQRAGAKKESDPSYSNEQVLEMMSEWRREKAMSQMTGDDPGPPPFANFIVEIAQAFADHKIDRALPSVPDLLVAALKGHGVGMITGDISPKNREKAIASFASGKNKAIVVTMAAGGTGLSLHDEIGDRPTIQINVNFPWVASTVDQVAARTGRNGLRSPVTIAWLIAKGIPVEERVARRVGGRMRTMGALVKGAESITGKLLDDGVTDLTATTDVTDQTPMYSLGKPIRARLTIEEMADAAEEMSDWKDWYDRHEPLLERIFGDDAPLFKRLLAATSPRNKVAGNVRFAVRAYLQILEGGEVGGFMKSHLKNLERILRDEATLGGLKVDAFDKALAGDHNAVVVDMHIAQLLFGTTKPTKRQIRAAQRLITKAAAKLGWTPRETQAALWAYNVVRRGEKVASYEQAIERLEGTIRSIRSAHGRGEAEGVASGEDAAEDVGAEGPPAGRDDAGVRGGRGGVRGAKYSVGAGHVSPHDFDEFRLDNDTALSGEGSNHYGAGLYFYTSEAVGDSYRRQFSQSILLDDKQVDPGKDDDIGFLIIDALATFDALPWESRVAKAAEFLREGAEASKRNPYLRPEERGRISARDLEAAKALESGRVKQSKAKTYKVTLAPNEDEWLDWDKPLSEQSERVRAAIWILANQPGNTALKGILSGDVHGARIVRHLEAMRGEQGASDALRSVGIPGTRYLDYGSRPLVGGTLVKINESDGEFSAVVRSRPDPEDSGHRATTWSPPFKTSAEARAWADSKIAGGTSNYVVFDAGHVKIDAKYSLSPPEREALLAELNDALGTPTRATLVEIEKARQEIERLTNGKVAIEFASLFEPVEGQHVRGMYLNSVISLALELDGEASLMQTARHEAFHFLKEAGVITPLQWKLLSTVYPQRSGDMNDEEHAADEWGAYRLGVSMPPPAARAIFDAMNAMLKRMKNWMAGLGFQTQQDIFNRLNAAGVPDYSADIEAMIAQAENGEDASADEPVGDGPREGGADELPGMDEDEDDDGPTLPFDGEEDVPARATAGTPKMSLTPPGVQKLSGMQLAGRGANPWRSFYIHRFIDYVSSLGAAGKHIATWAKQTELYRKKVINHVVAELQAAVKASGLSAAEWKTVQPHILAVVAGDDLRADITKKRARMQAAQATDPKYADGLRQAIAGLEAAVQALGANPADLWEKRNVTAPGSTFEIRWNDTGRRNARMVGIDPVTGEVTVERWSVTQNLWETVKFKDVRTFENTVLDLWKYRANPPASLKRLIPIIEAYRKLDDKTYEIHRDVAGTEAAGFVHRHIAHRMPPSVRRAFYEGGRQAPLHHYAVENLARDIVDRNPMVALSAAREQAMAMLDKDGNDRLHPYGKKMGSFESARGPYHDPFLTDYSMNGVEHYFGLAAQRIMEFHAWAEYETNKGTGQIVTVNGRKKIKETPEERYSKYVRENIKHDPRFGKKEAERVILYIRHVLGTTDPGHGRGTAARFAKGLARWQYGSKLFAVGVLVPNVFQAFSLGSLLHGPINPIRAAATHLGQALSGRSTEMERNKRAGAVAHESSLAEEFTEDDSQGGRLWRALDRFQKKTSAPFKFTERLSNSIAATAAFITARQALNVLRAGGNVTAAERALSAFLPLYDRRPEVARRVLERHGLSVKQIADAVASGGFDQESENTIRQMGASIVNFGPGANYLPAPLTEDDALAITFRTFRSFGYNVVYTTVQHGGAELQKGNIKPLIAMMVAAGLSGELIKLVKDLFADHDRERESDFAATPQGRLVKRLSEDLTMAGTLGLLERPADLLTIQGLAGAPGRTVGNVARLGHFLVQRPKFLYESGDAKAAAAMAGETFLREITILREMKGFAATAAGGTIQVDLKARKDALAEASQVGWIWRKDQTDIVDEFAEKMERGAKGFVKAPKWGPESEAIKSAILARDAAAAKKAKDSALEAMKVAGLTPEQARRTLRDAVRREAPLAMVPQAKLGAFEAWVRKSRGAEDARKIMASHRDFRARADSLLGTGP